MGPGRQNTGARPARRPGGEEWHHWARVRSPGSNAFLLQQAAQEPAVMPRSVPAQVKMRVFLVSERGGRGPFQQPVRRPSRCGHILGGATRHLVPTVTCCYARAAPPRGMPTPGRRTRGRDRCLGAELVGVQRTAYGPIPENRRVTRAQCARPSLVSAGRTGTEGQPSHRHGPRRGTTTPAVVSGSKTAASPSWAPAGWGRVLPWLCGTAAPPWSAS